MAIVKTWTIPVRTCTAKRVASDHMYRGLQIADIGVITSPCENYSEFWEIIDTLSVGKAIIRRVGMNWEDGLKAAIMGQERESAMCPHDYFSIILIFQTL